MTHQAATGDALYAAEKAGYAHPAQAAHKLMQRPAIVADIVRLERDRLHNVALPKAVSALIKVLDDDKASNRDKIAAAKVVLGETRMSDGTAKELHECTYDELQARILEARARQAQLANDALEVDAEVESIAQAASVFE